MVFGVLVVPPNFGWIRECHFDPRDMFRALLVPDPSLLVEPLLMPVLVEFVSLVADMPTGLLWKVNPSAAGIADRARLVSIEFPKDSVILIEGFLSTELN